MTIDEVSRGDVVVLRLAGEVDVKSAPALRQKLDERATAERPRMILNLERLRYIDSAGLGVLVGGLKSYAARGGRLVLVALGPEIRHILEITRLIKHFDVHANEDVAVAALT